MSNLKLKKLISLILCGSFMNCSISYAMFSDNFNNSFDSQRHLNSSNILNNSFLDNEYFKHNILDESNIEKNHDNQEQIKDDDDPNDEGDVESDSDEFSKKGKERSREQSLKKAKRTQKSTLNPKDDHERYNKILNSQVNVGTKKLSLKLVEQFPNGVKIENLPKLQELYDGFGGNFKVKSFDEAVTEIKNLITSWQNKTPTSKDLNIDPAQLSVPAQHVNNFILDLFKLGRMYSGEPNLEINRETRTITITFTTDGRGFLHTSVFDGQNLGQNGLGMKNDFSDIKKITRLYSWTSGECKNSQRLKDSYPKRPDPIRLYLNRTEELLPNMSDNEDSNNEALNSNILNLMLNSQNRCSSYLEKISKSDTEFINDLKKILTTVRKFKCTQYQNNQKVYQNHPAPNNNDNSFLPWLLYYFSKIKINKMIFFDTPFGKLTKFDLSQLDTSFKGRCVGLIDEIVNLYRNFPITTKAKFITFLKRILDLKFDKEDPSKIITIENGIHFKVDETTFPQYKQLIDDINNTKFVENKIDYLKKYHPGKDAKTVEQDVKKLFAKMYVAIFLLRPLKVGAGGKFSRAMVRQQHKIYNPLDLYSN